MTTPPKNPTATEATEPLPLPGLDQVRGDAGPLERATRRTLAALEEEGLVDERHSVIMQLMLDLAAAVTIASRKGQASAAAMACAQILAAYAVLVPEIEGGDGDAYDELAAELRAAARSSAQVRDST